MFGLMVVGAGLLYLILWMGAVVWAHRWANGRGYSKSKAMGMGIAAFLVMYLIPFWDHIPTLVAHKYYCEKEAGFWVYKTLDQWKAENPGGLDEIKKEKQEWAIQYLEQWKTEHPDSKTFVIEDMLKKNQVSRESVYEEFNNGQGKRTSYHQNDRFNWIVVQQDVFDLLPIIRTEQQVVDVKKNEMLARYVNFGTGNSVKNTIGPPGPLKFWMRNRSCAGGESNQDALREFRDDFNGSKK